MKCIAKKIVLPPLCLFSTTIFAIEENKDPIKLDTIVITASGYEQTIANAPASISVIDREELDKRNYTDITEVLNDVPGVTITGSGSTLDVSIRGMAPKYTLFLVDGRKQDSRTTRPNGDDFGLEKGILPPLQSIERIEVIRGPMSSLYGSDAMGGVVNIITKKVPDHWSGSYDISTTLQENSDSGDIFDTNIYLAGPLTEKVGMQVSANYFNRDEDNILGGFKGTERERINSKFTYLINDQHDIALGIENNKQTGEETSKTASNNIRGELRTYRDVYSLTHTGKYNDHLNSTSYIQYDKSKTPDRENTVMTAQNGGIRVNQPIQTETVSGNTLWNWMIKDHTLSFGAYYKDEELLDKATNLNIGSATPSEFSRWSGALFLEDTWSLFDNFNLTAGLRWDKDQEYGSHFSPRLYGVYHLNDNLTFKGGLTTGYKQPDLREAADGFWQVSGRGRNIILGNPNLKPESSKTYEFGTVWQGDLFNTSLTVYQTQFKDKIENYTSCTSEGRPNVTTGNSATWLCPAPSGAINYYAVVERINVGEAKINGVELTFDTQLNDWSTVRANYTFSDSEQKTGKDKGRPLNSIPKHSANITFDTEPTEQLNLWARYNYRGEMISTNADNEHSKAYNLYDVGVNYKFTPKITAKMAINNVFDKELNSSEHYKVLDGRRYTVGLNVNF